MSVHIDCDTCAVRGPACHDCVVSVLLGPPPELGFDEDEQRALEALAGSGLVPPLRMVRAVSGPEPGVDDVPHVPDVHDALDIRDVGDALGVVDDTQDSPQGGFAAS